MSKDLYFEMCEQMGSEPLDEEIPIEVEDFPEEIQLIFNLYAIIPDRWDTFNGYYLGKDLTCLDTIMNIKGVEDKATALDLVLMIDSVREKQIANKRKQLESNKKR